MGAIELDVANLSIATKLRQWRSAWHSYTPGNFCSWNALFNLSIGGLTSLISRVLHRIRAAELGHNAHRFCRRISKGCHSEMLRVFGLFTRHALWAMVSFAGPRLCLYFEQNTLPCPPAGCFSFLPETVALPFMSVKQLPSKELPFPLPPQKNKQTRPAPAPAPPPPPLPQQRRRRAKKGTPSPELSDLAPCRSRRAAQRPGYQGILLGIWSIWGIWAHFGGPYGSLFFNTQIWSMIS